MNNTTLAVVAMSLLLFVYNYELIGKIWRKILLFIHVFTGSRLFEYVIMHSPDDVPEDERVVSGLVFTNDKEYIDKLMEVMEE